MGVSATLFAPPRRPSWSSTGESPAATLESVAGRQWSNSDRPKRRGKDAGCVKHLGRPPVVAWGERTCVTLTVSIECFSGYSNNSTEYYRCSKGPVGLTGIAAVPASTVHKTQNEHISCLTLQLHAAVSSKQCILLVFIMRGRRHSCCLSMM